MPQREIYKSSSGDTWFLVSNESGRVSVVHEPNEASGGRRTTTSITEFLSSKNEGPEHQRLLQLIASLAEQ
jgi:hypothetical protein